MHRVVLTGLGIVSSLGNNMQEVRQSLACGKTGFCVSDELPPCIVCPVADTGSDAAAARLDSWRFRRYLSRPARLAVLAGLRAVADADFVCHPEDMLLVGTASPTFDFDREKGLLRGGESQLDALWMLRWLPNTGLSALSLLLGLHGESLTVNAACASSLAAMGEAFWRVASGRSACALVAAGDSRLSRGALLGYAKARVLSRERDPEKASRPFARRRSGFVPGEGGAAFVLESLEHAKKRGARILGEVLGYGATTDGCSLTAPEPSAEQAAGAVREALAMADMTPGDIGWVSAHGTGTPLNDEAEVAGLFRVFGNKGPWPLICAVKSWIGHGASACGALECAVCLATLSSGTLPPVRLLEDPMDDLPFVRGETTLPHAVAASAGLVQNFGFGGHNACMVLRYGALP